MNVIHNILWITLDSCRLDTAQRAMLPNINGLLGSPVGAEVDGTYTYASHQAFFTGRLPRRIDSKPLLHEYRKIWVSSSSKNPDATETFEITENDTIINHYVSKGYFVLGVGGVQFFNPGLALNILPNMFPEFLYYGNRGNLPEPQLLPRNPNSLPMNNVDKISEKVNASNKPYFLFINCSETHQPFDTPNQTISEDLKVAIEKMYLASSTREIFLQQHPLNNKERELILNAQIKAAEWVDLQFKNLISKLPLKYPTLCMIMGDHGEELGEHGRYGHGYPSPEVMQVPFWAKII